MYGRHPKLPIDIYMGLQQDDPKCDGYDRYVADLRTRLTEAYKLATNKSGEHADQNKQRYDMKASEATLEPGDVVLVKNVNIRENTR